MPAKEITEVQVNHHDESVANHGSQSGLIHKLYDVVLSRDTVKKSVMRIKETYHDVLIEGLQQIDGIKKKGEEVYNNTREKVKTWCYSITIYNHFTSLWLVKNLPFASQRLVKFDEFLSAFQNISKDTSQESEEMVRSFYKQASEVWSNLNDPSLDDIKEACLLITAKAIALDYKIEVDGFASALVSLFTALETKKHEIISNEAFYVQIRKKIHTKLPNEGDFRKATESFYTFAKRFAFLEFPLTYANQDILKVLVKFAQEKLDILGEVFLGRIDGLLNVVIRKLGYEYEEREDTITLLDRYHVIIEKMMLVMRRSVITSKRAIQESSAYQYLDGKIQFDDRIEDLRLLSNHMLSAAASVFSPAYNAITFTYNKVANEYVFVLYDVSRIIIKENYENLKKRYAILKDATLRLRDNVLEIKFTRETFDKLTADAKEQIALVYAEIKNLDAQKLKVYGTQAYKKAIDLVKGRRQALTHEEHQSEQQTKEKQD